MKEAIKEFFRWTCNRDPEGWFSCQHILYVSIMVSIAVSMGILLGRKNRKKGFENKLKVLKTAALVMLGFELIKIVVITIRVKDFWQIRSMFPLFLCSIMLFALPLAAFGKGRIREASLDFSFIFGIICCLSGTYLAGNYFDNCPVLSFDPMVSVTTHCISGFSSLYIASSGLISMKKKNTWISALILLLFEAAALIVDILQTNTDYEHNYMFLMEDSGTPFSICTSIAGGNQVLYTIFVAILYFIYLALFYAGYYLYRKIKTPKVASH
ncbi:MAG: YwaF family protein [Clostridia bacterium]|nr:YwaF family protein [Clostridia bacterium]